jgi:tetratricopeptide (TPR) repeat protein
MLNILSDSSNAEYWYLLGRAHMLLENYKKSHECFQATVYIQLGSPSFWISIGVLFFKTNQYRDSLDVFARAIRLNEYVYEAWYNLGVLVSYGLFSPRLKSNMLTVKYSMTAAKINMMMVQMPFKGVTSLTQDCPELLHGSKLTGRTYKIPTRSCSVIT